MKPKNLFLGLCVAVLLVSEFFLFSANRQKDAALSALQDAKQQISQLQKELQQATNFNVTTRSVEYSRLRAENQDLPRLRGQLQQLTTANQQLKQQLEEARGQAQQQQQQLQQLQAQNQQREQQAEMAAQEQSETEEENACLNNLRQIDAAKQQWALENNKTADAVPGERDLLPYFKNQTFPVCPSGGVYSINAVGVSPSCSIHGTLPSQ
ncbi:MAG TPA: hypothetical protein VHG71_05450 [Verrucomicrobiae bacterium]|nr:hypothetical protein [Verrucomicrobiae bacterium]